MNRQPQTSAEPCLVVAMVLTGLFFAADLILPRPAFSGSICVGLCARLLKRPGSRKAYLFALSIMTRFALKEQPANPCLLALHPRQEGQAKSRVATHQTTVLHCTSIEQRASLQAGKVPETARCRPQPHEILSGNDQDSAQKSPPERCRAQ